MHHPAYNLKVNKDADRVVMIETIRRVLGIFGSENEYRYIGFGGPFLEDFKRVHSAFPHMALVSIEGDENTYLRQKYHRFINDRCLLLKYCKAHTFIRDFYEPSDKDIFWLDYLDFNLEELNDFVYLATKIPIGSMLRITVRAKVKETLPGEVDTVAWDKIISDFKCRFGDLAPDQLTSDDFRGSKYCELLNNILLSAVRDELAPPLNRYFQPLVATYYMDQTQMFSLMGVVAECPNKRDQINIGGATCHRRIAKAFRDWDLASLDGASVKLLDVPPLSHKERLALQCFLPIKRSVVPKKCLKVLPYLVGNNNNDHAKLLLRYATLAPYYVHFARVEAL